MSKGKDALEQMNEDYRVDYKELTIELLKNIQDERIVKSLFYITEKIVSRET